MNEDDPRHGTDAGHTAHRKAGEPPCDPCRVAHNAYMRAYRAVPENHDRVNREDNARVRALWRLAAAHPEDYRRLYLIECGACVTEEPA